MFDTHESRVSADEVRTCELETTVRLCAFAMFYFDGPGGGLKNEGFSNLWHCQLRIYSCLTHLSETRIAKLGFALFAEYSCTCASALVTRFSTCIWHTFSKRCCILLLLLLLLLVVVGLLWLALSQRWHNISTRGRDN